MAFRFQRRIKIMPGLTLNLSKSGLGLSAGVRGARMSIGSRGVHSHVGLPGTGLAYRKQHQLNQDGRTRQSRQTYSSGAMMDDTVTICADSQTGQTSFILDSSGEEFSLARMRKLCSDFDSELELILMGELQNRNALLQALRTLHQDIPHPDLRPPPMAFGFNEPEPAMTTPRKPGLLHKFWPSAVKRLTLENERAANTHEFQRKSWETRKSAFEEQIKQSNLHFASVSSGDLPAMTEELARRFAGMEWPFEPEICFDLGTDPTTIAIDVGLPDEESFPALEWRMGAGNRRLVSKSISAAARRGLYRDYLHSVALRLIGELFAGLVTMHRVAISISAPIPDTQRGGTRDAYLLSMIVDRESWRMLNFGSLDTLRPDSAVELFELRRDMTKTGVFRGIMPFGVADLESDLAQR